MSDLISRCELFNRLATVQTLGDAYSVIQGMPTVEMPTDRIWSELSRVYNMADVPDSAKSIIGDLMLSLEGEHEEQKVLCRP